MKLPRNIDAAYDDEQFSQEEIGDIRESEKDIKAGRVRSLQEILRDLGDDKVIGTLVE